MLDILTGHGGYHSWDVTAGQVAASDLYLASDILVHDFDGHAKVQRRLVTQWTW